MSTDGSQAPSRDTRQQPGLARGALGLTGVVFQGVATIGPAFGILAVFQATVSFAGIVAPLAFLFAGLVILVTTVSVSQLAKQWPSAGGWYTWIAGALHPRAGFLGGWFWSIWLPPAALLTVAYLASAVLQPAVKAEYGVSIPWWGFVLFCMAIVIWTSYRGIVLSARFLLVTTAIEMVIMVALALSGLASPGHGGFNLEPFNPANIGHAPNLFLGFVFSIFAYSGWESIAPLAEESDNPRRNVPRALRLTIVIYGSFLLFVTWGLLVGTGTKNVGGIPGAAAFPGFTLAVRLWHGAWVIVLLALLNSAIAVAIGSFNGATRTWYAMGRAGALPRFLGKVHPIRHTPHNAIHLMVAMSALTFLLAGIFGVANTYFTWATMITLGLIILYALANIGVLYHYIRDRAQFNPVIHVLFPALSTVAVGVVFYKTIVPLPAVPEKYGPAALGIYLLLALVALVYLKLRGREDWLIRAGKAFDEDEAAEPPVPQPVSE